MLKVWTIDVNLPGASCVDIHNINPASRGRSGYCVLKTDHLFFAYCNMEVDRAKKAGWELLILRKVMPALVDGLSESYCSGGSSAGCHSASDVFFNKLHKLQQGLWEGTGISEGNYGCLPSICIIMQMHGKVNWYTPDTMYITITG